MMRTTVKAPLTGIKGLLRSSIGERLPMPLNRGKLSVAVRIRADRTFLGEVAIVEALTAGAVPTNQASLTVVVAKVLLVEVSEAVKQGNRATVVVQAARACPQEEAVVPEVLAEEAEEAVAEAEGAPVVVEAAAAVEVAGAGRNRQAT
jgi:hypothetical protein